MSIIRLNEAKQQTKVTNLMQVLKSSMIVGRVRHMMAPNGPLFIDPITKKITIKSILISDKPWVNIHHDLKPENKNCTLFKDILFDCYNIHPYYCKETCWKIVVHPTNFHDMIILIEIFREIEKESKVGIEHREYVPYNYGGYVYCDEMADGRLTRKKIQDQIGKQFKVAVEVVLKRGCTEMEKKFGPSKSWKPTPEKQLRYEDYVRSHFDIPCFHGEYPDFPDYDTMYNWMVFAWEREDMTVMAYNAGNPIFPIKIDYY